MLTTTSSAPRDKKLVEILGTWAIRISGIENVPKSRLPHHRKLTLSGCIHMDDRQQHTSPSIEVGLVKRVIPDVELSSYLLMDSR